MTRPINFPDVPASRRFNAVLTSAAWEDLRFLTLVEHKSLTQVVEEALAARAQYRRLTIAGAKLLLDDGSPIDF